MPSSQEGCYAGGYYILKRYIWHSPNRPLTHGKLEYPAPDSLTELQGVTRRDMLRHQGTQSQRMSPCISSVFANRAKIYFACQNRCLPLLMPLPSIQQPLQAPIIAHTEVSYARVAKRSIWRWKIWPSRSYRRSITF